MIHFFYIYVAVLGVQMSSLRVSVLCIELSAVVIDMRLKETARIAKGNFDYFATTLTLSPLKNANLINEIGLKYSSENTKYLPTDFKKNGGNQRSIELSRKYNLYRQNYCGCLFSKRKD